MKVETIQQTLFGTSWKRCRMSLTSGEVLELAHPDWILMSPRRTFLIVVLADDSYRVIEPDHVVGLDVERHAPREAKKRRSA